MVNRQFAAAARSTRWLENKVATNLVPLILCNPVPLRGDLRMPLKNLNSYRAFCWIADRLTVRGSAAESRSACASPTWATRHLASLRAQVTTLQRGILRIWKNWQTKLGASTYVHPTDETPHCGITGEIPQHTITMPTAGAGSIGSPNASACSIRRRAERTVWRSYR